MSAVTLIEAVAMFALLGTVGSFVLANIVVLMGWYVDWLTDRLA